MEQCKGLEVRQEEVLEKMTCGKIWRFFVGFFAVFPSLCFTPALFTSEFLMRSVLIYDLPPNGFHERSAPSSLEKNAVLAVSSNIGIND